MAAGDIVIMKSRWAEQRSPKTPEFWTEAPYMTREALEWLLGRRVRAVGFDFPQDYTIRLLLNDVRADLQRVVDEVTDWQNTQAYELNQEAKQKIIDAGAEVRQLTPEQRQKWVEAMQPVWEEFKDDVGQDVLDAALAANEAA